MSALRVVRESSSDDDEHDPEGPTLSSEWSRIRGLLLEAEAQLAETDAASARVEAGTYGLCQNCGRPIPPARLEARPAARLCVPCASALT
ncbi:TraR/DksA family transcriptional regulator [Herbiconiux ginsengi]|nr:TraR/DksA C4-type zinc finger protein [Herbiconiux ginsengi]